MYALRIFCFLLFENKPLDPKVGSTLSCHSPFLRRQLRQTENADTRACVRVCAHVRARACACVRARVRERECERARARALVRERRFSISPCG